MSRINPFFNRYQFKGEQNLIQSLITEATLMFGVNVIYIKRNLINYDQLYSTDDQSTYTMPIRTVVYLQSIDGTLMGPSTNIFSKFGLQINDQIVISMPHRIFEEDIAPVTGDKRPNEGDLIFFELNKKCFQIRYTNNKEIFYEFGELPTYQMTCELFQYSDETFNTGIPEIDDIQSKLSLNILDNSITDSNGTIVTEEANNPITIEGFELNNVDPIVDSNYIANTANSVIDFSENNAFGFVTTDED